MNSNVNENNIPLQKIEVNFLDLLINKVGRLIMSGVLKEM
jgi:hypothetical protein